MSPSVTALPEGAPDAGIAGTPFNIKKPPFMGTVAFAMFKLLQRSFA